MCRVFASLFLCRCVSSLLGDVEFRVPSSIGQVSWLWGGGCGVDWLFGWLADLFVVLVMGEEVRGRV